MDVYVARQPIFRKNRSLLGYELLFRDGLTNAFPDIDGTEATSRVLTNSFFSMGIEKVSGEGRAFVNFTRDLLIERVPMMFPRDQVVVEILEDIEPDSEVVEACREMAENGYVIALDDFLFRPEMAELIKTAKIIKFDLTVTPLTTLGPLLKRLSGNGIEFLAEKVETHEEFDQAMEMGFTYFQGYFFSRPEILRGRDVSSPRMNLLELMAEANRSDVAFRKLEEIIERDVAISYKLLRYINSAYFRRVSEVASIRQAILLMGERGIRRFLSLIAMASLASHKPDELIRASIVRARFCELVGDTGPPGADQAELFTLGLFSLIDAIMDDTMASLMEKLPLSGGIKEALVHRAGPLAAYLRLLERYEKGRWDGVLEEADRHGLEHQRLPGFFLDS
ncbi:MAG: HDOD domain-containing protein, partial [Deltaproteobacteria bacterium]|nr:HDOD domain-containing protein [Deltaproteobacteria bacterium]